MDVITPTQIWSWPGVRTGSADPSSKSGWLPQLSGDVQKYIYDKIFLKIRPAFPEIWVRLWEMLYLAVLKNL